MSNEKKMSNEKNNDRDKMIEDLTKFKKVEKKLFRELLDEALDSNDKYLAISAKMGSNKSYVTSVSLEWFANIDFASDLEIFNEHRDELSKSIKINTDTLDILSQRKPDWSRQLAMTAYLAIRDHHKFPPALLVAYQDWITDSEHDNWGIDERALQDSITQEPLDSRGSVINLNHGDTRFYALDGQHRLMAIRGLRDLVQGNLSKKNKYGKIGRETVTLDEIIQYHVKRKDRAKHKENVDENTIKQKLISMMADERIGVEIVPAVQKGETREEAFMRLREIFVDVNQNARRLEKGELALLDENDGFSIVARRIMVSHELFRDGDSLRVDDKSSQLNESSEHYTTLQTIVSMASTYLGQQGKFELWANEVCGIKGAGLLRPADKELEEGKDKLSDYFDAIQKLPSHQRMIQGTEVSKIRRRDEGGEDNVLFRPIAQEALARAVGLLERQNTLSLEDICKKLSKKDDIKFSELKLTDSASPFFGILSDPVTSKMRRQASAGILATDMFCYLLSGGMPDEDREILKQKFFESRRVTPDGYEPARAIGLDGEETTLDKFELPHPW